MAENVKVRWLVDNEQTKIAPKTLSSQILNEDGTLFKDSMEAKLASHSDNSEIHVTLEEKEAWSNITEGYATEEYVESLYTALTSNTVLAFYCIEDVTIVTNGISKTYPANSNIEVKFAEGDAFEIIPTSDNSILSLSAFPSALGTFYSWLEGVAQFSNILFDMNDEAMYSKWSQGNQGSYHVQAAQYTNCIFWSDNPYISDVSKRTNYTLTHTSQLPLCYSTIPDNTFKSFYLAFGVNSDPNWGNPAYRNSFAKATWATQAFSYYGARVIGIVGHDDPDFNITLPKDCRGLMFDARDIESAGTFDAVNTTNFGAKSGSWREAFGDCTSLRRLYIKNLKVNLNISWSPIDYDSISFIISAAANTSKITISVSPYTYNLLSQSDFDLATGKNITIELITSNYVEDKRLSAVDNKADANHTHDDLYYGKTEVDIALNAKADANHNHDDAYDTKGSASDALAAAQSYADSAAATVKNELLNGAGEAYDTLKELGDLIDVNVDAIAALETVATGKADKEHTHTVSDIIDMPEVVNADWNENNPESAAYVKNRTHWDSGDIIEWDGIPDGRLAITISNGTVTTENVSSAVFLSKVSDIVISPEEAIGGVLTLRATASAEYGYLYGETSTLVIEDGMFSINNETMWMYADGHLVCVLEPVNGVETGLYFIRIEGGGFCVTSFKWGDLKQLDEKYIPDTIARVEDVALKSDFERLETSLSSGDVVVKEAEHATEADYATAADSADSADHAVSSDSAIKAIQDAVGNVITETYETKANAQTTKDGLTSLINGKADAVHTHAISDITDFQEVIDDINVRIDEAAANGFSGSWNDLTDKPFGESEFGSDTITWDGNTDGLVSVEYPFDDIVLYKVCDQVPDLNADNFAWSYNYVYRYDNGEIEHYNESDNCSADMYLSNDLYYNFGGWVNWVIVPESTAGVTIQFDSGETVTFPEKGIYISRIDYRDESLVAWVSSLTIEGFYGFSSIKTIDEKYLPIESISDDVIAYYVSNMNAGAPR